MRCYANYPTESPGKLRQETILVGVGRRERTRGILLQLVGSSLGLERHIRLAWRLGFPPSRTVVVEREPFTFAALKRRAEELGFPTGNIKLGELRRYWDLYGPCVEAVDADHCAVLGCEDRLFLELTRAYTPRLVCLVYTLRRGIPYARWEGRHHIPDDYQKMDFHYRGVHTTPMGCLILKRTY